MKRYTITIRDERDQLDVFVIKTDEFTVDEAFTPDTHVNTQTSIVVPHPGGRIVLSDIGAAKFEAALADPHAPNEKLVDLMRGEKVKP